MLSIANLQAWYTLSAEERSAYVEELVSAHNVCETYRHQIILIRLEPDRGSGVNPFTEALEKTTRSEALVRGYEQASAIYDALLTKYMKEGCVKPKPA